MPAHDSLIGLKK
uniref:Uncharacterized protein n=1 Tax=Rhizophora mucronata TaxID=61149 RepID=A0A2P2QGP7_RHIMU